MRKLSNKEKALNVLLSVGLVLGGSVPVARASRIVEGGGGDIIACYTGEFSYFSKADAEELCSSGSSKSKSGRFSYIPQPPAFLNRSGSVMDGLYTCRVQICEQISP